MNLENILKTGNEVRVKSGTDTFISTIDDITGETTFTILTPFAKGHQLQVKQGETFSLSCVTERGIYMFEAQVLSIDDSSNVMIIHLRVMGDVRRVQRRQAFRVRENIAVNARIKSTDKNPDGKWVKTNTIDIAELGLLLRFDENCDYGQEMELSLRINMFGINEVIPKVKGKVVRCVSTRNKEFGYLLGIKFEDLPEKARDALIRLVVLSQRNKLTYKNVKKLR
ncbi:flagellar brake protein [Oscillospiraceae bacterium CM]|nr:flagellar brake protein [Oscillospiraceae bacterium CM]